jgi:endo-1,4-beta-xylanase
MSIPLIQNPSRKDYRHSKPAKEILIAAAGCLFLLSASCAKSESSAIASEAFPLTPSASPFQPESPSPTPSVTATEQPTSTPTPLPTVPAGEGTLRAAADRIGFGIGTYYQAEEAKDPLFLPVFSSEFNTVMMSTFMKRTEPEKDQWSWSLTDEVVGVALPNHQAIFGGPLVYDNQNTPAWLMFDHSDCGGWSAADLEGILQTYIQTIVSRFRGQAVAWEVVNQPITTARTCWRRILGDGYIERAFGYARAADPAAHLFLNEAFGRSGVEKAATDQFMALVKQLKVNGAPIDTVGIQMHLSADILDPSYAQEFQYFLDQARGAGVGVFITEMDVYQGPPGRFRDPLIVQKQIYQTITRTCLADPQCTNLIVWGVSDNHTWLAHLSGNDFINPQPLLFDGQFREKPAFFGVLDALQAAAG